VTVKDQGPVNDAEQTVTTEKVEICGDTYTIKGAVPAGCIRDLAADVDRRMRGLQEKYQGLPIHRVAVLVALNLAGELYQARKDNEELLRLLEEAR